MPGWLSIVHNHAAYDFMSTENTLNIISQKTVSVSLKKLNWHLNNQAKRPLGLNQ